jgi:cytochrome c oxidase assembly protein subunit 11
VSSPDRNRAAPPTRRQKVTAFALTGIVAGMLAMSFAAVPLYRIFCQVTGYGGTTQVAEKAPTQVLDREITVSFNADIAPGLAWSFAPVQRHVTMKIGETALAYYRARNLSDRPITGMATFNVTPDKAGEYFNKIACFCFTQQTLAPGESVDMPVTFFVDPSLAKDRNLDTVTDITLSYTFYAVDDGTSAKKTAAAPSPGGGNVN